MYLRPLLAILMFCMALPIQAQDFDLQGHRGARGLMPENTIPAFLKALDIGVTTLELDVVITKDRLVLVSHEPYISETICEGPKGKSLEGASKTHNIYQMTYDQIKTYDCGTLLNPRFPEQEKMSVPKPLLSEVFKAVEQYIKNNNGYEVDYNIELKCSPEGDGKYHPTPEVFSDLVHELIGQYIPYERLVIQSFDFRVLQYWHQKYPEVRLAALVENKQGIDANLKSLGFKPTIYSPYFKLLSKKKIKSLQQQGIKVIPWTINKEKQMERYIQWGVDGLITDYPDVAKSLLESK